MGFAESLSGVEMVDLEDDCFVCGQKLTLPFVYWDGSLRGLSFHGNCAARLAGGLARDAQEILSGLEAPTRLEEWSSGRVFSGSKRRR